MTFIFYSNKYIKIEMHQYKDRFQRVYLRVLRNVNKLYQCYSINLIANHKFKAGVGKVLYKNQQIFNTLVYSIK